MSIFRVKKGEIPFVMVSKNIVNDSNLSAKAKGIMLYLLSKPDDWKFYETEITNNMKDGIDSIRAGIKELISAGYIVRTKRVRDDSGKLRNYEYEVYEEPQVDHIGFSKVGKTYVGKSNTSNKDLSNTDLNNKEKKRKDTEINSGERFYSNFSKSNDEEHNLIVSIIEEYRKQYKGYKKRNHPVMKLNQLERVYEEISNVSCDIDSIFVWKAIISTHLDTCSRKQDKNDMNINAFATQLNLEILSERYRCGYIEEA